MIVIVHRGEVHNSGKRSTVVYELTCTEREDLENLPTSNTTDPNFIHALPHPGSNCLFTDKQSGDVEVHWLCADDVWRKL